MGGGAMTKLANAYDLVIVGSGGGSMVAAIAAVKRGHSVAILEKQAKVGGSTSLSGGVWWIPNNPLMQREGIADSVEKATTYLHAAVTYQGPASTPARRQAFLRAAPRMVEFLEKEGMEFRRAWNWPDYHDDLPGGSVESRSMMAKNFNIRRLGPWADKLATHIRLRALPVATDEFPSLFLLRRTLRGKMMAVKAGIGVLLNKIIPGYEIVANGAAIQGRMLEIALRLNIPIFPETPVQDLIVENGRVTGVVASHEGRTVRIEAKRAVLLNAGGFSRNPEMRKEFQRGPTHSNWTNANQGDTGEVLKAAMALGAATELLDATVWLPTSHNVDGTYPATEIGPDGNVYPPLHHGDMSLPFVIIVDQDGKRMFNESASYVEVGEAMYRRQAETGRAIPGWAIFDVRHRQRYPWGSAGPGVTPKQWLDSGYMKKADTLDKLARICGINVEGLKATVERFNGFARTGVDLDFNRGGHAFDRAHGDPTVTPNPNMGPIEQGPFYAVAMYPGDVGTSGGVVTDEFARVLKTDGTPIPGLYAAGNVAATPFGYCYPGAGASIAASFTFGWVGALHALDTQAAADVIR